MKQTILFLTLSIFLFSCNKEKDSFLYSPTALKFVKKETNPNDTNQFKYVYTCYKYSNQAYRKDPNTGREWNDLLVLEIFSSKEKPMGEWIDYVSWMKDTTILTFKNVKIDSVAPVNWRYIRYEDYINNPVRKCIIEATENELLSL